MLFRVREYTEALEQKGLIRRRQLKQSQLIHFDSNDYLSLAEDKRIADAYAKGFKTYASGSGASAVLSGYHGNHQKLERAFADFLGVDDCLLASTGFAANLAVTALLGKIKAVCLIDKGIHASIYDGLALSQVAFNRFIHNDLNDLVIKLNANTKPSVVLTEGIFSMTGQKAPLAQIAEACSKASLIVDEAHSFGILGNQGRGAVSLHDLSQFEVPLRVIPLGKAFAAQGAVIAGDKDWIHALLQAGRSLIYSTAISPALSYGLLKTLDIVAHADDRRGKLDQLILYCKEQIKDSPLNWIDSDTAIQQVQLGCPHLAMYYAQELKKAGLSCSAIREPTVNRKSSGLRIIINFKHQHEQIHQLFNALNIIYEHTPH